MCIVELRQVTRRFQLSEDGEIGYMLRSKRLSRDQISGYPRLRVRGSTDEAPHSPQLDLGSFDSADPPEVVLRLRPRLATAT